MVIFLVNAQVAVLCTKRKHFFKVRFLTFALIKKAVIGGKLIISTNAFVLPHQFFAHLEVLYTFFICIQPH